MERVYGWLIDAGYSKAGVKWLRQRRLLVIAVLALSSWAVFIGLGWLVFALIL